MTAQGSASTRFKRTLAGGDPLIALAAAHELERVTLEDALALCLVLQRDESARYERALVRWHGQLCREARLGAAEAQLALAALYALSGPAWEAAGLALATLADAHELPRVEAVIENWLDSRR